MNFRSLTFIFDTEDIMGTPLLKNNAFASCKETLQC